jgi:hypothetical protein
MTLDGLSPKRGSMQGTIQQQKTELANLLLQNAGLKVLQPYRA